MRTEILHDEHGNIVAVAKTGDLHRARTKFTRVGMVPGPGQRLVEVDLDVEHDRLPRTELHRSYRIDQFTGKLIKKD